MKQTALHRLDRLARETPWVAREIQPTVNRFDQDICTLSTEPAVDAPTARFFCANRHKYIEKPHTLSQYLRRTDAFAGAPMERSPAASLSSLAPPLAQTLADAPDRLGRQPGASPPLAPLPLA